MTKYTAENNSKKILPKRTKKLPKKLTDFNFIINAVGRDKVVLVKKQGSLGTSQSFFSTKKKTQPSKTISREQETIHRLGIENMSSKNYIASSIDKPELFSVKPVRILKDFQGFGVYARQRIPSNTIIGEYTGEVYTRDEFLKLSNQDSSYAMQLGQYIIDAKHKGNFTRYINFSDSQANIEFIESKNKNKKIVALRTIKEIYPGQQLLIDYNTYHEEYNQFIFLNPEDNWQR